MQKNITTNDSVACDLRELVEELFAVHLQLTRLNIDAKPKKKKSLVDFLLCLPEFPEAMTKKRHTTKSFVEAGMVNDETGMVEVYDTIMGTCKHWVSSSKNTGVPKRDKDHWTKQFQNLMKVQIDAG